MIYALDKLPRATREQIQASPRWRALFAKKPDTLLGIDNNAKTVKGEKYGMRTAILYLTPAMGSGVNLCPMAHVAKCDVPCLDTAGRGAMQSVQMARLRKTLYYLQYRAEFIAQLDLEIAKAKAKAERDGVKLLVRLNGTSDIRFEDEAPQLFARHSDVQFYDYTKLANRRNIPANYDLTFSYSGVVQFLPQVKKAKDKGMRIAAVFRSREKIPATFAGMRCVDGDDSDVRHLDPQGVIVALYAKGKAKTDTSGFVIG